MIAVVLTFILLIATILPASAAQSVAGIWVGGNESLIQIFMLDENHTGLWMVVSPIDGGKFAAMKGKWTQSDKKVVFSNTQEGQVVIMNSITIDFPKMDKEFSLDNGSLVKKDENLKLVKIQ